MAGVIEAVKRVVGPDATTVIPKDVKARLDRGRKWMMRDAAKRRLCVRFEKGETYWYINEKNLLVHQDTVTHVGGGGKPPHRIRNKYNFIRPIVEGKVSASTQRIPSYEVTPSTTDPEDIGGARLGERVAVYGYDKWRLRDTGIETVKLAIGGGGEGYALPYFDTNVGPYVQVEDPATGLLRNVGQGEVKIMTLGGNEVYWEPGVKFRESRWHAIERARPIEDVEEIPGFFGGKLPPDATTSDVPTDDKQDRENLVMVTEYFERPCPKYPEGRRLTFAGGKQVVPEEQYPLRDPKGQVIDEPILHRLVWTHDPDTDRDLGLVWQLIDPQRTIQDCYNKLLEWKNRCLNPQMIAPKGANMVRKTDEPGAVFYYNPAGGQKPEWESAPPVPEALFRIFETVKRDMREMAADEQVDAAADVAAKTVQAVIEQSQARWQSFLGDLAEWHSRLMRHCLLLVARHYTEPRLLQIKGRFGPELVSDFQGAQLMGQVDVTVLPGSIAPRTQQQVEQRVMSYAQLGWISPPEAMAAINGGTAEKLIEGYELDVARANRIIQKIRDSTVFNMPGRIDADPVSGMPQIDPQTGQPIETPGWMPREWDSLPVWKTIFSDWMKTEEFDTLEPGLQEVGKNIWLGIQFQEAQQQMRAMEAQDAQAEAQGSFNAAKPQTEPKPMPSLPKPGQQENQ